MTRDKKKSGDWQAAIRATCHWPLVTGLLIAGVILFLAATDNEAQTAIKGHASGFTSLEYYAPPNQTRVKSRMSGAEAQPLTGGLLEVKQLKLETFSTNGSPQVVVEAPECVYDMVNRTANSAGHLQLVSGDGKLRVEGDGFLWRQDDSSLTISNHVHMVIETGPEIEAGL
jgi:hypothetical protein